MDEAVSVAVVAVSDIVGTRVRSYQYMDGILVEDSDTYTVHPSNQPAYSFVLQNQTYDFVDGNTIVVDNALGR